MRFDLLTRPAEGQASPLTRIDARWTLLGTVAFLAVIVGTPLGAWRALAVEALVLSFFAGLSGLSPYQLVRRWLAFFLLVGFLAAMLTLGRPRLAGQSGLEVFLGVLAKNGLALGAMLVLAGVTPFPRLLGALARLGAPDVLITTLHFMERYIHVLFDELNRMVLARRARNFRRSGRLDWGILSGLLGVLFVRAMERGERVHAAMLARGWDGTIGVLDLDAHAPGTGTDPA
jgi:cobalt/nickel transport system permease protein